MTQDPPGAHEPLSKPHDTPPPHDDDSLQDPSSSGGLMAVIVAALIIGAVIWWLFLSQPADETANTGAVTTVTTILAPG